MFTLLHCGTESCMDSCPTAKELASLLGRADELAGLIGYRINSNPLPTRQQLMLATSTHSVTKCTNKLTNLLPSLPLSLSLPSPLFLSSLPSSSPCSPICRPTCLRGGRQQSTPTVWSGWSERWPLIGHKCSNSTKRRWHYRKTPRYSTCASSRHSQTHNIYSHTHR